MGLAELKRVTDLFVEGVEVVFDEGSDTDPPVLLWANKLNSFEAEEARRDGLAARGRLILALKEIGTPEYEIFQSTLAAMNQEQVVEAITGVTSQDRMLKVVDELRRDAVWGPKVESAMRLSTDMTEEEKAGLTKINLDYAQELSDRLEAARKQAEMDYRNTSPTELREQYTERYLEMRGLTVFNREHLKSQVYFGIRLCQATRRHPVTGRWDHADCEGHRVRAFDHPDEVSKVDAPLFEKLSEAVRTVSIERSEARFSDALASSSASLVPSSEAADSTASTQEETSPELVTTSS